MLRITGAVVLAVSAFSFAYFLTGFDEPSNFTTNPIDSLRIMRYRQDGLVVSIFAGVIGFCMAWVGLPDEAGKRGKNK